MHKFANFILPALLVLASAIPTFSKMIDLRDPRYAAVGDGVADDRPALARALSELKPGDTLLVPPGNYRIVQTKDPLKVPAAVALWGQTGKSKFTLASNGGPHDHREFLRLQSDTTLDGLTIERDADFPAVLLPMVGDIAHIELLNCTIVGNASRFPTPYCHAIMVGNGTLKKLVLHGVVIKDCSYGLLQSSEAVGTVDDVVVEQSTFERNTASDLEFNSPKGHMRNIVVQNCFFRDNQCKSPAAGFAVGFANVSNARVENCDIRNYQSEALHVEDRSADIRLVGNTIIGGSTTQSNGVIMILSDSKKVLIDHNFIDARANKNSPKLILVTAGGTRFANPSDVAVTNNVLINGATTKTWYLQPGSGPAPADNQIVPSEATSK